MTLITRLRALPLVRMATIAFLLYKLGFAQEALLYATPSQDAYRRDPAVARAVALLSRKWDTDPANLYIVLECTFDTNAPPDPFRPDAGNAKRYAAERELGIVDLFSLNSSLVEIVDPADHTTLEKQAVSSTPVGENANVFIAGGFQPASMFEHIAAHMFYARLTPSVIVSWKGGLSAAQAASHYGPLAAIYWRLVARVRGDDKSGALSSSRGCDYLSIPVFFGILPLGMLGVHAD